MRSSAPVNNVVIYTIKCKLNVINRPETPLYYEKPIYLKFLSRIKPELRKFEALLSLSKSPLLPALVSPKTQYFKTGLGTEHLHTTIKDVGRLLFSCMYVCWNRRCWLADTCGQRTVRPRGAWRPSFTPWWLTGGWPEQLEETLNKVRPNLLSSYANCCTYPGALCWALRERSGGCHVTWSTRSSCPASTILRDSLGHQKVMLVDAIFLNFFIVMIHIVNIDFIPRILVFSAFLSVSSSYQLLASLSF